MEDVTIKTDNAPSNDFIRTIEWDMMDKRKLFPLLMLTSFAEGCALYPLILINTRLQIQKRNDLYTGIFDAYRKIHRQEGFKGLYRGFWISSLQIFSGLFYVYTYEGVRHILNKNNVNSNIKALIAGGAASLAGETIMVPLDVLSQHLMMMGINAKGGQENAYNTLGIKVNPAQSRFTVTLEVIRHIIRIDGLAGFYRGYWASLISYVPNSACWWGFYHFYQDQLCAILPLWVSHLLIQSVAGTLGGFTTTVLTNPLDVVRARLQVQRLGSITLAFKDLWAEEGLRMFSKGLHARIIRSATSSFVIILGYESIKRLSVNYEYKEFVKW